MRSVPTRALRDTFALAALAAAAPLAAQSGANDSGTFRVLVEGRPAGTEEFSIRESGSGSSAEVVATGRVSLQLPSGRLELTPRLRASGMGADPVAYQVDIGGDSPSKIVGTVGSGRFIAKIVSAAGEQLREYVASSGAVVLDEGIAHHHYFLVRRGARRVPVLIPRENRQVLATVASRGEEPVDINGTRLNLFHFVVTLAGGEEHHVWVDSLNRVLRVDIPSRQYQAVRTEVPR